MRNPDLETTEEQPRARIAEITQRQTHHERTPEELARINSDMTNAYPFTRHGNRDGQFYAERNGADRPDLVWGDDPIYDDAPDPQTPWWAFPAGIIIAALILAGLAAAYAIYGGKP